MTLTLRPALDFSMTELAKMMTASFEDYFVPFQLDASRIARMIKIDGIDLELSRIAFRDDQPVATGFITQRGWSSRLAGMGVIKSERRHGVGKYLVQHLVEDAKARGDHKMVLEVIEQNEGAIALYKKFGFEVKHRLIGFKADELESVSDDGLAEVDTREVNRNLVRFGPSDLPWQLAPEAFSNLGGTLRGFRLGHADALVLAYPQIAIIQSLVVSPDHRRQGEATRLIKALAAHISDRAWRVTITLPEDLAPGLFESVGFELEALSQYEMHLELK
jgi:ribosomal protein S18 acetylase RimI-like enzyme